MKLLLKFSQMTKRTFPFALAMLCAACAHAQVVATNDLHLGYIGQPYVGQMTATGGTEPYTWSVSGGALPSGISLSSGGGLSGTPMAGGTFSVTIKVTDNAGSTANKTFSLQIFGQPTDQYGGLINKPCTNGPRAHFYTQKMGNRWYLCTPAGNAFFMMNVDAIATDAGTDYQGIVQSQLVNSKYATGITTNYALNWSLQAVRRLQSWGFTTVGTFSYTGLLPSFITGAWPTADHTIPVKLPYVWLSRPGFYSLTNSYGWGTGYVKDLWTGISTAVFPGYRRKIVDIWDTHFDDYVAGSLAHDTYGAVKAITGPHNDYLVGIEMDQMDDLDGFGGGPNFPGISSTTGQALGLSMEHVHLGWVALVTAPTQTSGHGVTYTDTTVYTKQEFSTWLSARYGAAISALNAAWGSNYTTFGSNGGFGVGSGILDENGLCPSHPAGCWVPTADHAYNLEGATAAMKADLNAYVLAFATHYFSVIKTAVNTAAPGVLYMGPTGLGGWSAPPRAEILQAAGQYLDVVTMDNVPADCANCTDNQQRIDFTALNIGDKPWISWRGRPANTDSYESIAAKSSDWFKSQASRGQYYQNTMMPQMFNACDTPTGTCHEVGFQWWAWADSRPEKTNWGLVTPRDDPYDGVSATPSQNSDAWGYPTGCLTGYGCEQASYGDFVSYVRKGNLWVLDQLAGTPPPITTINLTTAPH